MYNPIGDFFFFPYVMSVTFQQTFYLVGSVFVYIEFKYIYILYMYILFLFLT